MAAAAPVEILEVRDRPLVISLADGSALELRVHVVSVTKDVGQTNKAGEPIYHVASTNIVRVIEAGPGAARPALVGANAS